MKKFLLTLVLSFVWFIWYSSADTILFSWGYNCIASECEDRVVDFVIPDEIEEGTEICFELEFDTTHTFAYSYNFSDLYSWDTYEWSWSFDVNVCTDSWYYQNNYWYDFWGVDPWDSNLFKSSLFVYIPTSDSWWWWDNWWTWDNNWWTWVIWWILEWWTSQLFPVINSIKLVILEFIPLIIYVGLWILWSVIWFVAIKWLIAWIRARIYWGFRR